MKRLIALTLSLTAGTTVVQADTVELYAAGSLKVALSDVAKNYQAKTAHTVASHFGPSGLMRERIEQGESAHVFASANMKHPATLQRNNLGGEVVMFAQNKLCALLQPELKTSPDNLLQSLIDPNIRLGTSTPKADPSGDYAWQLFAKAEALKPGTFKTLDAKTLKLTGGRDSKKAPAGRNTYGWVMENNRADIFLTYCTNALLAQKQVPQLQVMQIPKELGVAADYGLIVLNDAPPQAVDFAQYLLSNEGQSVLASYGFTPVIK